MDYWQPFKAFAAAVDAVPSSMNSSYRAPPTGQAETFGIAGAWQAAKISNSS